MDKNRKIQEVVENDNSQAAGKLIVELLLDADEDIAEIAADFIENEVGRLDWQTNWKVIRARENPVVKIQKYLAIYGIVADPNQVAEHIDQMVLENPGRWK